MNEDLDRQTLEIGPGEIVSFLRSSADSYSGDMYRRVRAYADHVHLLAEIGYETVRLRAEVAQLREDNEKLRKESNSLRANRARLRRALLEHGSHDEDCHAHQHHDELAPVVSECDCGFSATLTPTGGDHE